MLSGETQGVLLTQEITMNAGEFKIEIKGFAKAGSTSEEMLSLSELLAQIASLAGHAVGEIQSQLETRFLPPVPLMSKDGFPGYPAE